MEVGNLPCPGSYYHYFFKTDDLTVGRLYEEAFVVSNFLLQGSKTWWIQMRTEEVAQLG